MSGRTGYTPELHGATPQRARAEPVALRRIAAFRALYLGDLMLAVPALRALRAGFPAAEITLISLPWAASFARRFRCYIDRFVEFAGYPGIDEVAVVPERVARFLAEQRAYGYDLVIQMHGSGCTSNPFVRELGAPATVGYYEGPARLRDGLDAGHGLTLGAPYPEYRPEIFRNLGLVSLLGCPYRGLELEFPLSDDDRAEAAALLAALPPAPALMAGKRPLVGIHAGSRSPARRWPARSFARVADYLARQHGARIVLTGGPGDEETARAALEHSELGGPLRPYNLAGRTSLGGLAALIEGLDLFISNDTGPAHVAVAVDTPSVTIFGPADPRRWAPLDQARHPIARRPVACSPCAFRDCPIDHRCLEWLRPEAVIALAESLLSAVSPQPPAISLCSRLNVSATIDGAGADKMLIADN